MGLRKSAGWPKGALAHGRDHSFEDTELGEDVLEAIATGQPPPDLSWTPSDRGLSPKGERFAAVMDKVLFVWGIFCVLGIGAFVGWCLCALLGGAS